MSKSHPVPFITGKRVDALQGKSLRDIPEIEVFLNDLSGSTDKFSIDNARSLLDLPYNKTSITALMLGMHGGFQAVDSEGADIDSDRRKHLYSFIQFLEKLLPTFDKPGIRKKVARSVQGGVETILSK